MRGRRVETRVAGHQHALPGKRFVIPSRDRLRQVVESASAE